MSKMIRAEIPDELWDKMEPLVTEYGDISRFIRKAIKLYLQNEKGDTSGRFDRSQRRGAK